MKKERKLRVGDVVMLNSGGPEMTVTGVGGDDHEEISCAFFTEADGPEKISQVEFLPSACVLLLTPRDQVVPS